MKELLDKLSSYNIFNYLLPGVLFAVITSYITPLELIQDDLIIGAFMYYFFGLVISRIGSLLIENILTRSKFVVFADYSAFIKVSAKDPKLDVLSESNNMYRTFISTFVLIGIVKLYSLALDKWQLISDLNNWIIIISLIILFLFSYKKQTKYITKRINAQKDNL